MTFYLSTKTNPSMAFISPRILLILLIKEFFLLLGNKSQAAILRFLQLILEPHWSHSTGRVLIFFTQSRTCCDCWGLDSGKVLKSLVHCASDLSYRHAHTTCICVHVFW